MLINVDLQTNYKLHLNNAIDFFYQALVEKPTHNYIYYVNGFCFSAFALELGLLLAFKETIKGDIFKRDKNNKILKNKNNRKITKTSSTIIKEIQENLAQFEKKILKKLSVKIDAQIIEEEINFILDTRNSLFHYQGKFDTEPMLRDIIKAIIFINILLPEKLSFAKTLNNKTHFMALLKTFSPQFSGIFTNVNEIFIHQDNYYDINIENVDICSECGDEGLISLLADKGHCYLCLFCSHHDYLIRCSDCGAEAPEENMHYSDYEDIFLCQQCSHYHLL